jgi:hypothetical protein
MVKLQRNPQRREGGGNWASYLFLLALVAGICYLNVSRNNMAEQHEVSMLHQEAQQDDAASSTAGWGKLAPTTGATLTATRDPFLASDIHVSKHPEWKLWEEMNEEQQTQAIQKIGVYIKKYAQLMPQKRIGTMKHYNCNATMFGVGGGHMTCGPPPTKPCTFISAGIRDDPSFDQELAAAWGCRGIAVDPSIDHKSHLHPLVTFHNIALNTIDGNVEMLDANRNEISDWWYSSVPGLAKTLGLAHIDILKMDCEGCGG